MDWSLSEGAATNTDRVGTFINKWMLNFVCYMAFNNIQHVISGKLSNYDLAFMVKLLFWINPEQIEDISLKFITLIIYLQQCNPRLMGSRGWTSLQHCEMNYPRRPHVVTMIVASSEFISKLFLSQMRPFRSSKLDRNWVLSEKITIQWPWIAPNQRTWTKIPSGFTIQHWFPKQCLRQFRNLNPKSHLSVNTHIDNNSRCICKTNPINARY